MKKLGKLSINTEKEITNEELVNLRGGYGGGSSTLYCKDNDGTLCTYDNMTCDREKNQKYCEDNCSGATGFSCV